MKKNIWYIIIHSLLNLPLLYLYLILSIILGIAKNDLLADISVVLIYLCGGLIIVNWFLFKLPKIQKIIYTISIALVSLITVLLFVKNTFILDNTTNVWSFNLMLILSLVINNLLLLIGYRKVFK